MNKIFAALFLFPLVLCAQVRFSDNFKVETGTPYRVVDAGTKLYLPNEGGTALSVKVRGEVVILQLFDTDEMMELKRNEYDDFPKYAKYQQIIASNGKLYYFFEAFNKKSKNFSVYYREIIANEAGFGKINKLLTTKGEIVGEANDFMENPKFAIGGVGKGPRFKFYKSADQSKILVTYRNYPRQKDDSKNRDVIGLYVFDSGFNLVWKDEKQMPYTEANMKNLTFGVSNEGKVYSLIYLKRKRLNKVFTFDANGKSQEFGLGEAESKLAQKFIIRELENGDLFFAGFYANGVEVKVSWTGNPNISVNTNGLLCFTLTKEGVVTQIHDFPFSIEFIKKYQQKKQKKKSDKREMQGKAGIRDLQMIDLVIENDGSAIFIGEQRFPEVVYYGTSQRVQFNYNHLVVAKMSSDGELVWMRKLPKLQEGINGRGRMGTKYFESNGRHFLFFIDDKENAKNTMDDTPEIYKDGNEGILTAFVIDNLDGNTEKHLIADLQNINGLEAFQFKTNRILKTHENTFMFEIYIKGKKDTMVKLGFNE